MNEPRQQATRASGSIIALTIIVGAVGGVVAGQPSIGFLAGAAVGILIAAGLWIRDRKRR
jgi:hypothetical protein